MEKFYAVLALLQQFFVDFTEKVENQPSLSSFVSTQVGSDTKSFSAERETYRNVGVSPPHDATTALRSSIVSAHGSAALREFYSSSNVLLSTNTAFCRS